MVGMGVRDDGPFDGPPRVHVEVPGGAVEAVIRQPQEGVANPRRRKGAAHILLHSMDLGNGIRLRMHRIGTLCKLLSTGRLVQNYTSPRPGAGRLHKVWPARMGKWGTWGAFRARYRI